MKKRTYESIAIVQLREAIELFNAGKFISALTLAGAAEEIFGKLSDESQSKKLGGNRKLNHASESAILIAHLNPFVSIDELSKEEATIYFQETKKEYLSQRNQIRNQLKHKDVNSSKVSFQNLKLDTIKFISGAIINLQYFKGEIPKDEELIMKFCEEYGIS